MKIITLGTGAGRPSLKRWASATALEYNGDILLFDCGEGTQLQLMRSSLKWSRIQAIFIGHLHGDHFNGLTGLLSTLSMGDRQEPLHVFGPAGIKAYLDVCMRNRTLWVEYPLQIQEVNRPGVIFERPRYELKAAPLKHVISCWGYAFCEKPRLGSFDVAQAQALGLPDGPLRGQLVRGEDVSLPDGRRFYAKDLVGPPRPGRKVVYALDTEPCAGTLELAGGADVLVHEATFDASMGHEASAWGHSTAEQAAGIAREAGVKRLILTHISQRYAHSGVLSEEAARVFENVELAQDLEEFEVE